MNVPRSVQRLALEVEGWLEFGCPDKALERIEPLLAMPGARPVALVMSVRAFVDLARHGDALAALEELRTFESDNEWLHVTEAWCRKRLDDLPGAIDCMRRLLHHNPRSAIGHFNLGCYLALRGEPESALDEVTVACGLDPDFRTLAAHEDDLVSLRGNPDFEALLPGGSA